MGILVAVLLILVGIGSIYLGLRIIELGERLEQYEKNRKNGLIDQKRIK